ncbi:glycosyltransferase family 4 protein [Paenibacillus lycopersici]|uniref:Glycosyltransferase family 4 protein n=1 Tax=Paenibacillus lycopersici TaxID=2704462 RepID=A0A6C0FWR8_9BACL|nr:glycosyltransferase family 4 protein [Paenibacillus lycopersici]
MKVWLLKEGEPLPSDNSGDRLFRMGMLAEELAKKGHEVIWWSSTFNHTKKQYRHKEDKQISIAHNYKLELIHSISYKGNISLRRVIHQTHTAKKFARRARQLPRPDLIFCAMPTIDLAYEAAKLGTEYNIPVVLDIRDLWPDIYADYFPAPLKNIVKFMSSFSRRTLSQACNQAYAITGLTTEYLNWGINYANRLQSSWDRVFPLGYKTITYDDKQLEDGISFFEQQGIASDDFIACFFGQIGYAVDLDTVLQAAELTRENKRIKYVLCGTGEKLEGLKAKAKGLSNVYFPGWVDANQIQALMRISKVGIIPYKQSKNYEMNLPNKFAEYLSGALPMLLSVRGIMKETCEANQCGHYYENEIDLANYLYELELNESVRQEMSKNSKKLFDNHFKAEKIYDEISNYLVQIVDNHKAEIKSTALLASK